MGYQLVPAGAVQYFAGKVAPDGWLVADGRTVSRSQYPDLLAAIGVMYGMGDGLTTFNLPDLRGEFIRGVDDGRGVDAGRTLGSAQSDAIRNITGTMGGFYGEVGAFENPSIALGVFYGQGSTSAYKDGFNTAWKTGGINFDASRVVPTANENRPRNIALLACIKY